MKRLAHSLRRALISGLRIQKFLALGVLALSLSVIGLHAQVGILPPPNSAASGPQAFTLSTGNGIEYHGGPIMINPHNVYYIWYGNWGGNSALSILPQFMQDLNGSPYFNINTTYADGNGTDLVNSVSMSGQIFDNYSQGTSLNDATVQNIVGQALANGLPTDPNGIYFVLSSADVDDSLGGAVFCTNFCGYHGRATLNGTDIKYSWVGNPDFCPAHARGPCTVPLQNGPNGNVAADAMASVIAHELDETVTDPDLNAWFHVNTAGENGDLCAWTFGTTFGAPNGANANVIMGATRFYLIQQNWVNATGGSCAMSAPPICYQAHVENIGWQPQVCDGAEAGTTGQSLRMEAITITAPGRSICYQAHVENIGWQAPVCDGAVAGTTGQGLRIEALRVWIQSGGGHVLYYGHVQNIGWTGPASDAAIIGTTGQSLRLEAVTIGITN